jgi:hypothetical protein
MSQDELQNLLSKQACFELSCRYNRGLDRLDGDLINSVFHQDGWCEYGFFNGKPADFIAIAMQMLGEHESNHHMLGQALIDIEGDQAYGEVYFNAYHKVAKEHGFEDLTIAGRYIDRYERRDGVWKIAYRSERNDFSRTEKTNDPFFTDMPECLRGSRSDDVVYDRSRRYPQKSG